DSAREWYADVFDDPRTLVPAVIGLLLFSAASILLARALADRPGIPRWLAWAYGATAPLIGILGLMVDVLQPIGSTLLLVAGALIAARLTSPRTTDATPTPSAATGRSSDPAARSPIAAP